ncbi:MAG: bifunctional precorrin-2 dehydrogenase/sirohydrochlorin ferrochelatase [Acidobacteriota bacterium]
MPALPVVLDLRGVPCLVVGAGRVASRKIAALVRAGARVRVVAPGAAPRVRTLARRGRLVWVRSRYRRGGLGGARLVVAATSDRGVNREVAREAKRRGRFVNVVDDPDLCSLLFPAVLARGPLLLSVSTSGASPALARALRDELAKRYGPEYGAYVRLVATLRRRLRGAAGPR